MPNPEDITASRVGNLTSRIVELEKELATITKERDEARACIDRLRSRSVEDLMSTLTNLEAEREKHEGI